MLNIDQDLKPLIRSRFLMLCGLFGAELLLLAIAYQFFAQIECYQLDAETSCTFLRSLVGRAISVLAVSIVLVWAWPGAFARFVAASQGHRGAGRARALHLAGVALLALPLALFLGQDMGAQFHVAVFPWAIGALAAALGAVFWLAPASAWGELLSQDRHAIVPILLVAAVLPDLAEALRPIWDVAALAKLTFGAVAWVLVALGQPVVIVAELYEIGIATRSGGFAVQVGQPCSGIEGIALVTGFVLIYGYIFRRDLRLPLYLAVVLPIGLMLSWVLNVVRIAALILIGAHASPDLAVNGFHSYAGWLFFTLLALAIVWAVQATHWLHRGGKAPKSDQPLRSDLIGAQILPFVAFMLISTVISAVLQEPELGYPVKAGVMAGALLMFWPALRRLEWGLDRVAIGAGALIGLGWIMAAGEGDPVLSGQLLALPPVLLGLWVAARLVGTVLLVPVIEELFFRGYVLSRLDGPRVWQRALAIAVSSLAFGALHGRWVAAGLAGVIFALLALRRGRVGDAILAHVIANLVVAVAALIRRDVSLI